MQLLSYSRLWWNQINQFHETIYRTFSIKIKILLSQKMKNIQKKIPWNWFISRVSGLDIFVVWYKPGIRWRHEIGHLDTVFQVVFRHRIRSTRDFNYRAFIEIIAKQSRINGGRHQNYSQIGISVNHVTKDNHDKIWANISFVDFIDDDMRHTPNGNGNIIINS